MMACIERSGLTVAFVFIILSFAWNFNPGSMRELLQAVLHDRAPLITCDLNQEARAAFRRQGIILTTRLAVRSAPAQPQERDR
jgi:hypothetical protein